MRRLESQSVKEDVALLGDGGTLVVNDVRNGKIVQNVSLGTDYVFGCFPDGCSGRTCGDICFELLTAAPTRKVKDFAFRSSVNWLLEAFERARPRH